MPKEEVRDAEREQVREALRRLAKQLHERNEFRQIGARDEDQIVMMHSGPAWDADDWR